MEKKRIAYICGFSNSMVREKLSLKSNKMRNYLYSLLGHEKSSYLDYAIWNSAFCKEFEKYEDYEFHIVSPHAGMRKHYQNFSLNNLDYHFFKSTYSLITDTIISLFKIRERSIYKDCRKRISRILKNINPDIVVVCGAEQPYYSPCVLDIDDVPVYVLLQTLVSLPDLRSVMKYSDVFCKVEDLVFPMMKYVAAGKKYHAFLKEKKYKVQCLPIAFPTYMPVKFKDVEKQYDFVFYASSLSKNKGVEDVLLAFNVLLQKYPSCSMLLSGRCDEDYLAYLKSLVKIELIKSGQVKFMGLCDNIEDKYKIVQTARIVVLPGITAPLNSTVRESMLMGMPTIVYETSATKLINKDDIRLLEAKMEDVKDLAAKMIFAYEHPLDIHEMAVRSEKYAMGHFSNKTISDKLLENVNAIYANYYNGIPIPKELIDE